MIIALALLDCSTFLVDSLDPLPPYPGVIEPDRHNAHCEYIHQQRLVLEPLDLRITFLALSNFLVARMMGLCVLVDTVRGRQGGNACETGVEKLSVLMLSQLPGLLGGIVLGVGVVVVGFGDAA